MNSVSLMEKFKKTLSLRKKKKDKTPEDDPNNKPLSWQEDEKKVREGCCSFQVKYLGFIEVFDSRGMQVCEEAIKALRRPKKKTIRAILYVSGDTIRVSDEISKGLIVDQTIEKVSFCSPDRNHKRGFAYICRDGTTRRWMCHAFLAVKETGERLSHAVGCAFAICLEKKQKRETDVIQPATMENRNFQKGGSFRQTSLTERLQDPQSVMIADFPSSGPLHPPAICTASPNHSRAAVIPRPHASASFFSERQTSLRMFPKLQESSPFKRELSLRLAELPGSSPTCRRTEKSIDEEKTECDTNDNKDNSGRLSAFSTFSKSMYTSDNSANDSPAHRMSESFQSDSSVNVHSNPFLLTGAINYGASSTFASQEAINSNIEHKNDSQFKIGVFQDSFQKLQVSESNSSQPSTIPTNGFTNTTNFDNSQNIWQNRTPINSIITSIETSSTNPWCEPSYPAQSEFIHECQRSTSPQLNLKCNSELPSSTLCSFSDPFDISWISNKGASDNNGETRTPNAFSNNPFLS